MGGLIFKDFYINRRNLLLYGVAVAILSALFFIPVYEGEWVINTMTMLLYMALAIIYVITGSSISGMIAGDENPLYENFIKSSPCMARGQVRTKYIEAVLLSAGCFGYSMAVVGINRCIAGFSVVDAHMVFAFFLIQILLKVFELPFLFCFGTKCGNIYKSVIVYGFIFAVIVYGLYGDISAQGIVDSLHKLSGWFDAIRGNLKVLFIACLCTVTGLLYYASYKISCIIYAK